MKKPFAIFIMFISIGVFGQTGGVGINANGNPPDSSAILDLKSTNKGLLMPRLTQTQRDSINSPAFGLLILNTTTNCVEMYGFGYWQSISCLCSGPPLTPSVISGNNNPCANSSNAIYSVGLVLTANAYTWTVPADATIIAGQGTNSITVNFGVQPGNISVTANNNCGTSSASVLPVTIDTIPPEPGAITGSDTVCANSTGNVYSINAVAGATSYNWTLPSGTITAGQGTTTTTVSFGGTQGNMSVTAGNVCGNSEASVLQVVFPPATGSVTFNYTGNVQSFVVPACVSSLSLTVYGAQGGDACGNSGGNGATATGALSVTPSETLYIYVGNQPEGSGGGFDGGGDGYNNGSGGGGASDVRVGGTGLGNRVIVAGGGGGTTCSWTCIGGSGGGGTGGNGTSSNGSSYIGSGGTQDGGGSESPEDCGGSSGSSGQGGNASDCDDDGGGGGGGYYGGGGSDAGGAGGGSGYIGGVTNGIMQSGVQSGNGQVVITW